ncbi:hypothetical protein [Arcanobacterium phocae]|uniref:hypothetical protein n=1 Tax=Arcanobacterium phocae TaxID=131112 RepID=UPI001C0EF0E2|nr:hypothetical protein [Arcanobacterium phocae]
MKLRRITAVARIYRSPEGVDADGYPLNSEDYREWSSVRWPVYSIQPRERVEEFEKGRVSVRFALRVSAPVDGPLPGPDDVVELPGFESGGAFNVIGEVAIWDNNPILRQTMFAGAVVSLERRRR